METNISVVGSIALDTLETPKGNQNDMLGGSATYFAIAASKFSPVEVIGIVGDDFPDEGWDVFNRNNEARKTLDMKAVKQKLSRQFITANTKVTSYITAKIFGYTKKKVS